MLSLELSNYSKLFMHLASQLNKLNTNVTNDTKINASSPTFSPHLKLKIPSNQKK